MRLRLPTPRIELPPAFDIERRTPPPTIGWRTPPPIVPRIEAAVAYQDIGTVATGGSGSGASPGWPTHIQDDYGILVVVQGRADATTDPGAATLSDAQGFTAIASGSKLSQYTDGLFTNQAVRVTLFEARASSGSMSAPTVNSVASNSIIAYIITFRGAATSGSAVDVVSSSANNANDTSVSIAGADPSVAGTVVLAVVGSTITGGSPTVSSWTNGDLTSFTERADSNVSPIIASCATGGKTTDAAYGASTATLSANGTWAGVAIAIKPAGASGGGGNLLLLGVG